MLIIFFFSVSALTVFQSWFLRDGYLVFFPDIILLQVSTFTFSSCISVCSVVFRHSEFRLKLLCVSIQLEDFYFSVFAVSFLILRVLSTWFPTYFWVDFYYFIVRKPTFLYPCPSLVSKSLACCFKYCIFFPDVNHSFSIPSLCRVISNIVQTCSLPKSIFSIGNSDLSGSFVYLKKEKPKFAGCWLWREHPSSNSCSGCVHST